MTDVEEAKMQRNAGISQFLSDNAAAYAADNAFGAGAKKFNTDYPLLLGYASNTGQNNSGFSQEKLNAKTAAGEAAAIYCSSAQVILESLGLFSIANSLNGNETFYIQAADSEAASRLQSAYSILSANLATITPDYVTAADLENLQKLINTFVQTNGSSQEVHALNPELTTQFKSGLKTVDTDVKNIQKLAKRFKLSNVTFYNDTMKICKMPPVIYRHTIANITINDSATGAPIVGATGSFSNSKNTMISDATGLLHEDQMHDGNPTLTITATGYPVYTSLVHIVHGTDNSFHILLTKG